MANMRPDGPDRPAALVTDEWFISYQISNPGRRLCPPIVPDGDRPNDWIYYSYSFLGRTGHLGRSLERGVGFSRMTHPPARTQYAEEVAQWQLVAKTFQFWALRFWTDGDCFGNNAQMQPSLLFTDGALNVSDGWHPDNDVTLFHGDCRSLLQQMPAASAQLVVTSPPYNIGKKYEKRVAITEYLRREGEVINLCIDALKPGGSICWQIGNHVDDGEVFPLDILLYPFFVRRGLRLRNRIVWHFEHGLHCSQRFSGRYETVLWFTKADRHGAYVFNLDPIRVPQKYPGKKHFKGPKKGLPSANPLGKNPGDVWIIPNVKHNHPEKTIHPCQFPVELVERLVLSLSNKGDLVLDPYMGVGSTLVAAVLNGRRAAGADVCEDYVSVARTRVAEAAAGTLRCRPRTRPVYVPSPASPITQKPW